MDMQNKIKSIMATLIFAGLIFIACYYIKYTLPLLLGGMVVWVSVAILRTVYEKFNNYFQGRA